MVSEEEGKIKIAILTELKVFVHCSLDFYSFINFDGFFFLFQDAAKQALFQAPSVQTLLVKDKK